MSVLRSMVQVVHTRNFQAHTVPRRRRRAATGSVSVTARRLSSSRGAMPTCRRPQGIIKCM